MTEPASALQCVRLATSTTEADYRSKKVSRRNATEGLSAEFDVWGGNEQKRACLSSKSIFSMDRPAVKHFFDMLRSDNKGRSRDDTPWL